jgi:outer membrane protein assembly factor BamB
MATMGATNHAPRTPAWALVLLLAATPTPLAAQVPQRQVETPIDFVTSQDDNLFSLLRSQDQIHEFESGLQELATGEVKAGVARLHKLLAVENGGVVPVSSGRFLGLRLAIVLTLANLEPAARAEYDRLAEHESGATTDLLALPEDALLRLAERFPASNLGQRARIRLGDLALAAGDGLTAAGHFRSALDGTPIGSSEERRVADRLQCATTLVDPDSARSRQHTPQAQAGDEVLAVLADSGEPRRHGAYGGGSSGRTPMAPLAGTPDTRWSPQLVAPGFGTRDIGNFAMFPVGDLDGVYVVNGRQLFAFDPLRAEVVWDTVAPLGNDEPDRWQPDFGGDGVNQDMVLAAACNADVVVAALQVPESSRTVDFQGSLRVMSKMPLRRLFCYARASGKLLWSHFDELEGARTRRFRGHEVCASPLIAGDTVYVPVHDRAGAIAFALAAYDLKTGAPKWKRLVCSSQQDVNMFGNARTEFAASPIALHDGVVYGSSNLGVTYAVEAQSGRIRWITAYDIVYVPRATLHQNQERHVYFANNAPVVTAAAVCMTPLDSQFVLAFDTETGRQLWRLPAEGTLAGVDNRITWLCGAFDGEFVLAGAGAIAAQARPEPGSSRPKVRQIARPAELGDRRGPLLTGRPAVTADAVWFVRNDALLGFSKAGEPLQPGGEVRLNRLLPGNLLLLGGIAVSARQGALEFAFDAKALLAHVENRANANPDDPAALLRLASLHRALLPADADDAQVAKVVGFYRRGLEASVRGGLAPAHPVRQALQRELYEQAMAQADAALQRSGTDALAKLEAAREVAPDTARWLAVQALVLARVQGDRANFHRELDRVLTEAADAVWPLGDGVPVRTFVTWQRASTTTDPAAAVALWQELLEQHADVPLGDGNAHALSTAAITALVQQHGATVYAPVQQRAERAFTSAGADRLALEAVVRAFPNSDVAGKARLQLLDLAVHSGDLGVVCQMLAASQANGGLPPGILRRVMVAAARAGNQALATAMGRALRDHADVRSDWPADAGATYGTVLQQTQPSPTTPPALTVPTTALAYAKARDAGESLLPTVQPDGFAAKATAPAFVRAGPQLLAVDPRVRDANRQVLFATAIEWLDHVVLCGDLVVVPDMVRVFALAARTGELKWEMPNERNRQVESLGVQDGVLLVWRQPPTQEGLAELLGIEPLTGTQLWRQTFPGTTLKPKAIAGGLLHLTFSTDGSAVLRLLDATCGRTTRIVPIDGTILRQHVGLAPDSLAARLFPQWLAADAERVFLPVDGQLSGEAPRLCALDRTGKLAWHWRGTKGSNLLLAGLHGDLFVLAEGGERTVARVVVLQASDGARVRELDVGRDATVLNWRESWLANPVPDRLAVDSFTDADRTTRQFVCVSLAADEPTFALPLGPEDGEVLHEPLFGADFVTFGTRPVKGKTGLRLWAVGLRDRAGLMPSGAKVQSLPPHGIADGMVRYGDATLISARGLHLHGAAGGK